MLVKTTGIVLRTVKYAESSVIADIFTANNGLRSFIAGGVRTRQARISPGLLQIMMPLEFVSYFREDRDLCRLKEARALHVFKSIPFDIRKGAVGMFMTEVARKAIHGQEENQDLYQLLLRSFIYLDETQDSIANLHLHFMLQLSAQLGFMPGGSFSEHTPYFNLLDGNFEPLQPVHAHWLSPHFSEKLSRLLSLHREQCHQLTMTREERSYLLKQLINYFRLHVENFPAINSHQVLEEVLGAGDSH